MYKTIPRDVTPLLVDRTIAEDLIQTGRFSEAEAIVDDYLRSNPTDEGGSFTSVKALLLAKAGKPKEAEEAIGRAVEIGKGFGHYHHTAYNIASAYAALNRPDDAVRWSEVAAENGFPNYAYFEIDPNLNKVRKHQRFARFMAKLKPHGSDLEYSFELSVKGVIQNLGSKYFKLQNRITWERKKGHGAKKNWKNSAEDIWFFTRSDEFTFNIDSVKMRRRVLAPYTTNGEPKDSEKSGEGSFRDTHPSNIWTDIGVPFWSMPANPAQKPEKLLAKIILASTNPSDLILDLFAGSGTTAVTAKKLGRSFVAIESDENYCLLALKRLERAEMDKSIQGFTDGVFWERNSGK